MIFLSIANAGLAGEAGQAARAARNIGAAEASWGKFFSGVWGAPGAAANLPGAAREALTGVTGITQHIQEHILPSVQVATGKTNVLLDNANGLITEGRVTNANLQDASNHLIATSNIANTQLTNVGDIAARLEGTANKMGQDVGALQKTASRGINIVAGTAVVAGVAGVGAAINSAVDSKHRNRELTSRLNNLESAISNAQQTPPTVHVMNDQTKKPNFQAAPAIGVTSKQ